MRVFYLFKLLQLVLTAIALISIFSTNEICSSFILNKVVIKQILNNVTCKQLKTQVGLANVDIGAIIDSNHLEIGKNSRTRMGKFLSDVLQSWDKAWGYEASKNNENVLKPVKKSFSIKSPKLDVLAKTEKQKLNFVKKSESNLSSDNIGFRQCAKVYFEDYFGRNDSKDSVGLVLAVFGIPIVLILFYFVFILFHTFLQSPLPYGCFSLTFIIASIISWMFVLLRMINLEYRWDEYFLTTNIRPELMSSIVVLQVISMFVILLSFFEMAFSNTLMKEVSINSDGHSSSSSSSLNGEVTYYDPNIVQSTDRWTAAY